MGWVHDTGYGPAYRHEGFVAVVLDDGTETAVWSSETTGAAGERVTAWRAGCDCGWRAEQVHRRADYGDDPEAVRRGWAPDAVDGWEPDAPEPKEGISCFTAWEAHVRAVLPELEVHDAIEAGQQAVERIETAVRTARAAGASWGTIGEAAHMSRQGAWERWRHLDAEDPRTGRRLTDQTPYALAAAVDGLEDRGPVATARKTGQGWQITVTDVEDDVLDRIDVDHEWGPASMGHRLIEAGWIVCSPAVHVRDRAAGWAERGTDTYTAPVVATDR